MEMTGFLMCLFSEKQQAEWAFEYQTNSGQSDETGMHAVKTM